MPEIPLRPEHWVDELFEKHECGPYRHPVEIKLDHADRPLTLIAPWDFEENAVILELTISNSDDLLYVVAKELSEHAYDGFNPILIVARRRGLDLYEVVIWHQLYSWALERLGLGLDVDSGESTA